ncbi:MAG: NADPH:quinone oxidoreductase family protein [Polyangiaceae bacterium]
MGKRVVVSEFGETPLDALEKYVRLEEQAPIDTSLLAPTDVVVDVKSASINWVDLLMTSGQYQHMAKPPYVPGLEYAGVIAWVGPSASTPDRPLAVGDRVLSDGFLTGPRSLGGYQAWGGFASRAVAPAAGVHPIPGDLDFDQACNLLGNYETAYHCLVVRGRLTKGETVLIHGASGGTGVAAVHVAKLVGATVIATGRSPEKLERVKREGADHVVSSAGFRDAVKSLTNGQGVDVVYDGVGGDISIESLRAVRFGARYLIVGWAATPFVARGKGERGAPNANQLPTNLIMMKGLDVLGCPTVIGTVHNPSLRPPRLAQILEWAREGKLRPVVSRAYPIDQYKEAMLAKWNGEVTGGSVLHP